LFRSVAGCLLHQADIQRSEVPGEMFDAQGRAHRMVVYDVTIGAGPGGKPGVELVIDDLRPTYRDRIRQIGIAAKDPAIHIPYRGRVKVHDLPDTMDTGIGTPGTMHQHIMIRDPGDRLFEFFLNGVGIMPLTLPTAEAAAIVFHT